MVGGIGIGIGIERSINLALLDLCILQPGFNCPRINVKSHYIVSLFLYCHGYVSYKDNGYIYFSLKKKVHHFVNSLEL